MPWRAAKRATVLIPSGPDHDPDRKHLHIVVTDPTSTTGEVLIVCVVSIPTPMTKGYDPSCTLFPGEHPFVVKDSFIAYRHTRIVSAGVLEEKVASGEYIAKQILGEKQFQYVIAGLHESPYVAPKFLHFFKATQA